MSSGGRVGLFDGWGGADVGGDGAVDGAGDVALEAADDGFVAASFGSTFGHVGLGGLVPAEPADDDDVQRPVALAVTAAVESVVLLPAGGRVDG